jgi:hypothetical protein
VKTAILYDKSGERPELELSDAWWLGSTAYWGTRRASHVLGARDAAEAINWLEDLGEIDELQFWGHGKPGKFFIGREVMTPQRLARVRVRGVFWIRACASFAGLKGHNLALDLADALDCKVAGHTFNIGPLQSGLRTLSPGRRPSWGLREGLDAAGKPKGSALWHPRTITVLHTSIPRGW